MSIECVSSRIIRENMTQNMHKPVKEGTAAPIKHNIVHTGKNTQHVIIHICQ